MFSRLDNNIAWQLFSLEKQFFLLEHTYHFLAILQKLFRAGDAKQHWTEKHENKAKGKIQHETPRGKNHRGTQRYAFLFWWHTNKEYRETRGSLCEFCVLFPSV